MNVFILTDYDRQGEFYSPWDRRVSDKIYPEMTVYDLEQQLLKEVFGIEDFQFGYRYFQVPPQFYLFSITILF